MPIPPISIFVTIKPMSSSGSSSSARDKIAAIKDYLTNHNQYPRVFIWRAPADKILTKLANCKEALDALH